MLSISNNEPFSEQLLLRASNAKQGILKNRGVWLQQKPVLPCKLSFHGKEGDRQHKEQSYLCYLCFPLPSCVSSTSSQSNLLLQVSSSLCCRAAPCSMGRRTEGDLNSVVTACGSRNPPGSGHHKAFLETWSYREEVGREKQEDSLAASVAFSLHLHMYLLQESLSLLELLGTDG